MNRRLTQVFPPLFVLVLFLISGFRSATSDTSSYKCMIQLTNYTGEGAYIVISLIDPQGQYESTLYIQGDDEEWYSDMKEWWKFYKASPSNIDGIVGATVSGGGRKVNVIQIPDDKIDEGYSIRFESAVEDQEYYKTDVEFKLTSESVKSKVEGKGFIRYVRMMPYSN